MGQTEEQKRKERWAERTGLSSLPMMPFSACFHTRIRSFLSKERSHFIDRAWGGVGGVCGLLVTTDGGAGGIGTRTVALTPALTRAWGGGGGPHLGLAVPVERVSLEHKPAAAPARAHEATRHLAQQKPAVAVRLAQLPA